MDFLLVTMGSAGDVHPFVGLGRALRARGRRVAILTYPAYADLVRSAGVEYLYLPRPAGPMKSHADSGRVLGRLAQVFDRRWRKLARRSSVLPLMRSVYEGIARHAIPGRTVVVAHHTALGARIAHDCLGTPLVSVQMSAAAFRSVWSPPVMPPLWLPPRAPRWYVRTAYQLLDLLVLDRLLAGPVNAYRRELGLPPVRRLYAGWNYSPQRVLGLFPDWFGPPQPDWPPQTRLTGFPLFDRGEQDAPPAAVRQFLDGASPPVVLTATSETRKSRRFFETGVEACLRLGRRALLLTRYREQVPDPLPEGFLWTDYAPFSHVLPRAAAIVHHGGIGTGAHALAAGVPQVVVPIGHDHFDNARRLERLGVARVLRRRDCNAPALSRTLHYLLGSPEVAACCRQHAGRLAGADALGEACRLIEEMQAPCMGAAS